MNSYFNYIVLNGEQKGKIWGVDLNKFDTMPAGVVKEYDFSDWCEAWLKKAFAQANEGSVLPLIQKLINKLLLR